MTINTDNICISIAAKHENYGANLHNSAYKVSLRNANFN